MRTVTVGNAGRSLPGMVSLPTVEEELASHGSASGFPELAKINRQAELHGEGVEGKGPVEQTTEIGLGGLNVFAGSPLSGKQVEEAAKESPLSKGEKAVEKGLEKVNPISWTQRLSELLSAESLKRFGLIVAGALLLLIAVFMVIHAMGGPTPIPLPV